MTSGPARLLCAVALVAGLASGACSSDDSGHRASTGTTSTSVAAAGTQHPPLPDPCTFVTSTELREAFGQGLGSGVGSDQTSTVGTRSCSWILSSTAPPQAPRLTITIGSDESLQVTLGQRAQQLFEGTHDRVHVDENLALGYASYRAGSTVSVLYGRFIYSISTGYDTPAGDAALVALATDAVRRGGDGL